jgi:hypothetical protein
MVQEQLVRLKVDQNFWVLNQYAVGIVLNNAVSRASSMALE